MTTKPQAWKIALLALWSTILTALTFIFGATALRAFRVYAGENIYWLVGLLITAIFLGLNWQVFALSYFGLVLMVGVFSDLEERGQNYFYAGLNAIVLVTLIGGGIFAFWLSRQSTGWFDELVVLLEAYIQKVFPAQDSLPVQIGDLLRQAPSVLIMIYVMSLYIALLLEKRVLGSLGVKYFVERRLSQFRVPDLAIWIFIPSLLGSFANIGDGWLYILSLNVFNVLILLYFFQGLAVLSTLFARMKMSPFWHGLLMVLFAIQLSVLVAAVGVIDFWVDFRKRMKGKSAQINKEIYRNK